MKSPEISSNKTFDLNEENLEAREYYAASLFILNKSETAIALMDSEEAKARFAGSDLLVALPPTKPATPTL